MTIKYKKRSRHFRGSRHNGYGIQGQNRKKGLKGGFGKTGFKKHRWTLLTAMGLTKKGKNRYFGKHGFKRPKVIIKDVKA
ncbi:MAG: 50S ribosomal protein L15, partial [Promethearchaeota archaeon]